jgi:hypothetical protein
MFAALLDTSVLWSSLQRDFLLSLAVEGMYRPLWSSEILTELEFCETEKLIKRGEQPDAAATRARHLIDQMTTAFDLLGEAFQLRGSMHLSSYDRLFPSQDVRTGRGS